uniref:Uncharacterized protein n=1 Tax=Mus musculus TaxID=10090 RepID=Q3TYU4_MOUSE|nr:unnamed protein product [Mus musculus]
MAHSEVHLVYEPTSRTWKKMHSSLESRSSQQFSRDGDTSMKTQVLHMTNECSRVPNCSAVLSEASGVFLQTTTGKKSCNTPISTFTLVLQ